MTERLQTPPGYRDGLISETAYHKVARLLQDLTGIHLPDGKRAMVSARLTSPLRRSRAPDIDTYCRLLSGPGAVSLREEFISALTTNTTQFHREAHHFEHLAAHVLPTLSRRAMLGERVRLWSAGCASGEEAYGLAFGVLDACPTARRLDLRILATDIDRKVLAQAREGVYPASAVKALPRKDAEANFVPGPQPDTLRVQCKARELVAFRPLNFEDDWPFSGRFDVIFCRNVAIYFDEATQARLWQRMCERIAPGGVLYIGHSEHLPAHMTGDLTFEGNGIFRRGASRGKTRRRRFEPGEPV